MTIALVLKVNDGVVLAADSASTMTMTASDGSVTVGNIYNNANKVFNLHKGLPIGALTWGLGNIGPASIATLTKDLRTRLQGDDDEWAVDPVDYEMNRVAGLVRKFMFEERFQPMVAASTEPEEIPTLGFLTAGYSTNSDEPEIYVYGFGEAGGAEGQEVLAGDTGAMWWGQPEAITRLINGISPDLPAALANLGVPGDEVMSVTMDIAAQLRRDLVPAAMPIADAIDLARFLVHTTIEFVRFSPGSAVVGGPIEIATITKHEGFKWVARKHYFEERLNPRGDAL